MTDLHKECHCSVKIEHLSVTRGNQKILDDVNLEVKHGEITAIIGRNGAGKTTLMRVLTTVLAPTSGKVLLDGTLYLSLIHISEPTRP